MTFVRNLIITIAIIIWLLLTFVLQRSGTMYCILFALDDWHRCLKPYQWYLKLLFWFQEHLRDLPSFQWFFLTLHISHIERTSLYLLDENQCVYMSDHVPMSYSDHLWVVWVGDRGPLWGSLVSELTLSLEVSPPIYRQHDSNHMSADSSPHTNPTLSHRGRHFESRAWLSCLA